MNVVICTMSVFDWARVSRWRC